MAPIKYKRGSSCGGVCAIICTVFLGICWGLTVFGMFMCHVAIAKVVPPLQNLPKNLETGFYNVLKFDQFDADALAVKTKSAEALGVCDFNTINCNLDTACPQQTFQTGCKPSPVPTNREESTQTQKDAIVASFSRSLNTILTVATDKYLGTAEMNDAAGQMQTIITQVNDVDGTQSPCIASNELYCGIWLNADELTKGTAEVKREIDKLNSGQNVKDFEEYSGQLINLHALPYVLVLAMVFFTLFWWKDAACCCCGGSCCGAILGVVFAIFWLLYFIISVIIVAAGYLARNELGKVELPELKGKPTIAMLMTHLETEFPEFFEIVFKDLIDGLNLVYSAFIIFLFTCIIVLFYSFILCCVRPYTKKQQDADAPGPAGEDAI